MWACCELLRSSVWGLNGVANFEAVLGVEGHRLAMPLHVGGGALGPSRLGQVKAHDETHVRVSAHGSYHSPSIPADQPHDETHVRVSAHGLVRAFTGFVQPAHV